jgi:hypothetical protein
MAATSVEQKNAVLSLMILQISYKGIGNGGRGQIPESPKQFGGPH